MLGVFVDTFIVCTSTAIIILVSGVYHVMLVGVGTDSACFRKSSRELGRRFPRNFIILILLPAVLGNYAYAEGNMQFINNNPKVMFVFRILVLVMVYFGAIGSVPLVFWSLADLFMGIMATINLVAILSLTPDRTNLLKELHLTVEKSGIKEPEFKLDHYPELKKK